MGIKLLRQSLEIGKADEMEPQLIRNSFFSGEQHSKHNLESGSTALTYFANSVWLSFSVSIYTSEMEQLRFNVGIDLSFLIHKLDPPFK